MTLMVGVVSVIVVCGLAVLRTKVDLFPALNMPVIYVCQPYGGLDANQVEGLLTNYYDFHFLYVSGIHHVERKNIQGMALMKLYFHPGTDMSQAMSETVAAVNRSRFMMPQGTAPLDLAVIGGLVAATAARLFVLPAVFALLQRRACVTSASLDPADPGKPAFRR